jgi:hypothetical protein
MERGQVELGALRRELADLKRLVERSTCQVKELEAELWAYEQQLGAAHGTFGAAIASAVRMNYRIAHSERPAESSAVMGKRRCR